MQVVPQKTNYSTLKEKVAPTRKTSYIHCLLMHPMINHSHDLIHGISFQQKNERALGICSLIFKQLNLH